MSKKVKPTTKLCKYCKTEIPYDAKVCPQCRKKVKGNKLLWIIIALIVFIAIGTSGGDDKETPTNDSTSSENETLTESETPTVNNETTEEKEDDNVPTEYKSALKSAEVYSDMMHMSKQGIYDQLISEFFIVYIMHNAFILQIF